MCVVVVVTTLYLIFDGPRTESYVTKAADGTEGTGLWYELRDVFHDIDNIVSTVSLAIFSLEFILKCIAGGFRHTFPSKPINERPTPQQVSPDSREDEATTEVCQAGMDSTPIETLAHRMSVGDADMEVSGQIGSGAGTGSGNGSSADVREKAQEAYAEDVGHLCGGWCADVINDDMSEAEKPAQAGTEPYLNSMTNKIDFTVLCLEFLDIVTTAALGKTMSVRFGRTLRPLRMIQYHFGLQKVCVTFALSLSELINIFVLSQIAFLIFGIMGVALFGGGMVACNDGTIASESLCIGLYDGEWSHGLVGGAVGGGSSFTKPRVWVPFWRRFDNIGMAYSTLFEVASLDCWSDVMYNAMDITQKGNQPQMNANNCLAVWLYFIIFILMGLTVLNFFIAVVVNTYCNTFSIERFRPDQRQWLYLQKLVSQGF